MKPIPNKQKIDWEKEFDKKFTRKSKGLKDKGKYMDRWFVRETTSEELKDFISQLLSTQRQQLIKAIIKNLKFYNWKGNIKTVELKEYLKSL